MSSCIVDNVQEYIYIYMLCDHIIFMSLESCSKVWRTAEKPRHIPLRQSRPYQTGACFHFPLTLRVDPFLLWPTLERFNSIHRFQLGKIWSRVIYCTNYDLNIKFHHQISPTHTDALFIYTLEHPFVREVKQRKTVFSAMVFGWWSVFGFHFYVCLYLRE